MSLDRPITDLVMVHDGLENDCSRNVLAQEKSQVHPMNNQPKQILQQKQQKQQKQQQEQQEQQQEQNGLMTQVFNKTGNCSAICQQRMFLLVENPTKSNNLGPIVRCCVAFGIETILLIGYAKCATNGSHGASKHVNFLNFSTVQQARLYLKEEFSCTNVIGMLGPCSANTHDPIGYDVIVFDIASGSDCDGRNDSNGASTNDDNTKFAIIANWAQNSNSSTTRTPTSIHSNYQSSSNASYVCSFGKQQQQQEFLVIGRSYPSHSYPFSKMNHDSYQNNNNLISNDGNVKCNDFDINNNKDSSFFGHPDTESIDNHGQLQNPHQACHTSQTYHHDDVGVTNQNNSTFTNSYNSSSRATVTPSICLVLSKERHGLPYRLAKYCTSFVHIPNSGIPVTAPAAATTSSTLPPIARLLNVPSCLSIFLHEWSEHNVTIASQQLQCEQKQQQGTRLSLQSQRTAITTDDNNDVIADTNASVSKLSLEMVECPSETLFIEHKFQVGPNKNQKYLVTRKAKNEIQHFQQSA